MAQHPLLQRGEARRGARARPGQRDAGIQRDAAAVDQQHAVGQCDGFGHTGFTGCVFWLDPASRSFYVLLSNRVHPTAGTIVLPLYGELGTLAAEAAGVRP